MDSFINYGLGAVGLAVPLGGAFIGILLFIASRLRKVVSTNETHTVQRSNGTTVYGTGLPAGNVYYGWPSWIPRIGVLVTVLPASVFQIDLMNFNAYDKGRVPFVVDIVGFFRITDARVAAARIVEMKDFKSQLVMMLRDVMRAILASFDIEEILQDRSKFGERFTQEVDHQLQQWGAGSAKQIGLMDIRDNSQEHSEAISNIMRKKQSQIDRESRVEVAANKQQAANAETAAAQSVEVRKVEAVQNVGQRNAEKDRQVGIAQQQAAQAVKEQEAITAEKAMAVIHVNTVRQAEITKAAQIVLAEQSKAVQIVHADGDRQAMINVADGELAKAQRNATAIQVQGEAEGKAKYASLIAPVNAQIELANKIGGDEGYQTYLVRIELIKANQAVGVAQAEALKAAEIKVIANTATPMQGVESAMQLLTPKGAMQIGAALDTLKETEVGKAILDKVMPKGNADGHGRPSQAD